MSLILLSLALVGFAQQDGIDPTMLKESADPEAVSTILDRYQRSATEKDLVALIEAFEARLSVLKGKNLNDAGNDPALLNEALIFNHIYQTLIRVLERLGTPLRTVEKDIGLRCLADVVEHAESPFVVRGLAELFKEPDRELTFVLPVIDDPTPLAGFLKRHSVQWHLDATGAARRRVKGKVELVFEFFRFEGHLLVISYLRAGTLPFDFAEYMLYSIDEKGALINRTLMEQ